MAPENAKLSLQVPSIEANKLVVRLDEYVAEVQLQGGSAWEAIELTSADFKKSLVGFNAIRELSLGPTAHFKASRGLDAKNRYFGAKWSGDDPICNDAGKVNSPDERGGNLEVSSKILK